MSGFSGSPNQKDPKKLALDESYSGKQLGAEPPKAGPGRTSYVINNIKERGVSLCCWHVVLGSVPIKQNNVDTGLSPLYLADTQRVITIPVSAMGLLVLRRAFGHSQVRQAGMEVISTSEVKKPRLREVNCLAQGHTARKGQSRDPFQGWKQIASSKGSWKRVQGKESLKSEGRG